MALRRFCIREKSFTFSCSFITRCASSYFSFSKRAASNFSGVWGFINSSTA